MAIYKYVICKILFARCCLFVVCVYVQDCHKGNVAVKDGEKAILVVTYYVCTGWVSWPCWLNIFQLLLEVTNLTFSIIYWRSLCFAACGLVLHCVGDVTAYCHRHFLSRTCGTAPVPWTSRDTRGCGDIIARRYRTRVGLGAIWHRSWAGTWRCYKDHWG